MSFSSTFTGKVLVATTSDPKKSEKDNIRSPFYTGPTSYGGSSARMVAHRSRLFRAEKAKTEAPIEKRFAPVVRVSIENTQRAIVGGTSRLTMTAQKILDSIEKDSIANRTAHIEPTKRQAKRFFHRDIHPYLNVRPLNINTPQLKTLIQTPEVSKRPRSPEIPTVLLERPKSSKIFTEVLKRPRSPEMARESSKLPKLQEMPTELLQRPKSPEMPTKFSKPPKSPDMPRESLRLFKSPDMPKESLRFPRSPDMPRESLGLPKSLDMPKESLRLPRSSDMPKESSRLSKSPDMPKESLRLPKSPDMPKELSKPPESPDISKESSELPKSPGMSIESLKLFKSADVPTELLKRPRSPELPTEFLKLTKSSDMPTEFLKRPRSPELPTESLKLTKSSDMPTESLKRPRSPELPTESLKLTKSSDMPTEFLKRPRSPEMPIEVLKRVKPQKVITHDFNISPPVLKECSINKTNVNSIRTDKNFLISDPILMKKEERIQTHRSENLWSCDSCSAKNKTDNQNCLNCYSSRQRIQKTDLGMYQGYKFELKSDESPFTFETGSAITDPSASLPVTPAPTRTNDTKEPVFSLSTNSKPIFTFGNSSAPSHQPFLLPTTSQTSTEKPSMGASPFVFGSIVDKKATVPTNIDDNKPTLFTFGTPNPKPPGDSPFTFGSNPTGLRPNMFSGSAKGSGPLVTPVFGAVPADNPFSYRPPSAITTPPTSLPATSPAIKPFDGPPRNFVCRVAAPTSASETKEPVFSFSTNSKPIFTFGNSSAPSHQPSLLPTTSQTSTEKPSMGASPFVFGSIVDKKAAVPTNIDNNKPTLFTFGTPNPKPPGDSPFTFGSNPTGLRPNMFSGSAQGPGPLVTPVFGAVPADNPFGYRPPSNNPQPNRKILRGARRYPR